MNETLELEDPQAPPRCARTGTPCADPALECRELGCFKAQRVRLYQARRRQAREP